MTRLSDILKFISWPALSGLLVAVVLLQMQQQTRIEQQLAEIHAALANDTQLPSFSNAIREASESVVSISAKRLDVQSVERATEDQLDLLLGERESLGSGIVIDDRGFILTNLHVVNTFFNAFDTEVVLKDGRTTPATVIAWDRSNDLAILHVNVKDLTPIKIGSANTLDVGDTVFAIGYPHNVGQSVSQGIVSAVNRNPDDSVSIIQTDAAVNPGNSGGALIDVAGSLVGINSSIYSESGNFEGIGFAIPVSLAMEASIELIEEAIESNSGYLGVLTGEALTPATSELFFGTDEVRGMLVENVDAGGAAEAAGIRPGDVITRIERTAVTDGENIVMEVLNRKPGDTIVVEVYREGETFEFPTTLGFGQAIVFDP